MMNSTIEPEGNKRIVFNSPEVVKFVSDRIFGVVDFPPDAPSIGLEKNGRIIAGVVYTMYTGNGICMHVAADGKGWMTKNYLYTCFAYPFIQLACTRVTGLVRADNLKAQKFDEHLGFVREGVIREGDDDGCDLILYGMLRRECRWLK